MQALQRLNGPIFADGSSRSARPARLGWLAPGVPHALPAGGVRIHSDFFTLKSAELYNDLRESLYHPALQSSKIHQNKVTNLDAWQSRWIFIQPPVQARNL